MATATAIPGTSLITPLHLSGNTTEAQNEMLQKILGDAVLQASRTAIQTLDRHSAQLVLDLEKKLLSEVTGTVLEIIHRNTISDKYKTEEAFSNRKYPDTYRVGPIEAQVTGLRKLFPGLGACQEKIARRPLPDGAEAWFAFPRWQALAPTYNEAVEKLLEVFGSKRKFQNRILGRMGPSFLRQSDRTRLAEKILAEQQPGTDIFVVAAQHGLRHRGRSARRTRVVLEGNEFALGVFQLGCMLLNHPERLSSGEALMVDCGGDEYSFRADGAFDRIPLFDYDLSGIEFSIFYEDRARDLWGTPSGFLFQMA
jgi:hypothetical protein